MKRCYGHLGVIFCCKIYLLKILLKSINWINLTPTLSLQL
jgi:hypothetical protein